MKLLTGYWAFKELDEINIETTRSMIDSFLKSYCRCYKLNNQVVVLEDDINAMEIKIDNEVIDMKSRFVVWMNKNCKELVDNE